MQGLPFLGASGQSPYPPWVEICLRVPDALTAVTAQGTGVSLVSARLRQVWPSELGRGKGANLISRKARSTCPLKETGWIKPQKRLGWRRQGGSHVSGASVQGDQGGKPGEGDRLPVEILKSG